MARDLHKLRNIGIIAHIDAGKTTVTERMLFYCGATHKMGEVDKGTAVTDYDVEEQQRGITINAACVTFTWKDVVCNLIDTPGHVDFTAEVERSLRVLDGGIVVFSAREGVEAQSETVWRQADKYKVPRLAFINKMDREGADFEGTLGEIRTRLAANPVAIQIPLGVGPPHMPGAFRGIVDLVGMKILTFVGERQGAVVLEEEIPPEIAEEAELWRGQMLDELFNFSNELGELLLAEAEIPVELVKKVIREATLHQLIVPVLCGSALDFVGIQPLLDAVADYLPSPAEMPPVKGIDPNAKAETVITRPPDPDAPFCGLVFKIEADPHGAMYYVRVYSGRLKEQSRAINAENGKKENISQLWHIQADRRKRVKEVEAGDIVGLIGLRHSVTGDTLCDAKHPIVLEPIVFSETVISMAIEPESTADRKKLADALEMMKRQDPTFRAQENEETGQTLISGMGELHLEIIKNRLVRDFNLNVRVHNPRVSYRETVERAVEATGHCRRPLAGASLSAEVRIRIEPLEQEDGRVVVTTAPDAIAELGEQFLGPTREVLTEQAEGGGTLGFPLIKTKITILGGKVHETESNEIAFRHAAADAFAQGLKAAGVVLLEPIMRLEVSTPEEYLGDIVADLQKRRAVINKTQTRGQTTVIEALAPLSNMFGYSNTMRGLSQGRANCSMEPATYSPAPDALKETFM